MERFMRPGYYRATWLHPPPAFPLEIMQCKVDANERKKNLHLVKARLGNSCLLAQGETRKWKKVAN